MPCRAQFGAANVETDNSFNVRDGSDELEIANEN
jgi:hypothetical protein